MPTTTTATCEPDLDGEWRIVVTHRHEPGWLGWLLGRNPTQRQESFIGKLKTWNRYPSLELCDEATSLELWRIWVDERSKRRNPASVPLRPLVSAYSNAVGRYGPDSEEARRIRKANNYNQEFIQFADGLDRVKRRLGGSGIDSEPKGGGNG